MCKTLDIKLNEIPDWNCCGASIGYAGGGELPRHVMNARNIALAETTCPVRTSSPPAPPAGSGSGVPGALHHNDELMADTNRAEGGRSAVR
jgi:heterodisulfide reductase subunit B2